MPLTPEEIQEKRQIILAACAEPYVGAIENRITNDKHDAALIREMLNSGLLERQFANVGRNGLGFRLFITEKGRHELIPEEDYE